MVSVVGLVFGSRELYGVDTKIAAGVAVNLVVGLPILLGSLWVARRGTLMGLLLWPGALFSVLYTYVHLCLLKMPF